MSEKRRLLIDVGHPADLHLFRPLAGELKQRGWECLFSARDKDVMLPLLRAFGLAHRLLKANRGGLASKLLDLSALFFSFLKLVKAFQPELIISSASLHSSWAGFLLRIPHIAFIDTEPRRLADALTLPFIQAKITAHSYMRDLGRNHFRYSGSHELAYLHPHRFQPDPSIRQELGLGANEPYAILRFVAWKALHDFGMPHMDASDRLRLARLIASRKRLFITSEEPLADDFHPWHFPLPPERIHHALAFADLYIGEGITMAAEAAVLGTPAVLINSLRMGYCVEAEKAGMLFPFSGLTPAAVHKIDELLSVPEIRSAFSTRHAALLAGKIDVTGFMTWFVTTYPESLQLLRQDPGVMGPGFWNYLMPNSDE